MNNVEVYKEHIYAIKMTIDNHISQNQQPVVEMKERGSIIKFDELLGKINKYNRQ